MNWRLLSRKSRALKSKEYGHGIEWAHLEPSVSTRFERKVEKLWKMQNLQVYQKVENIIEINVAIFFRFPVLSWILSRC